MIAGILLLVFAWLLISGAVKFTMSDIITPTLLVPTLYITGTAGAVLGWLLVFGAL